MNLLSSRKGFIFLVGVLCLSFSTKSYTQQSDLLLSDPLHRRQLQSLDSSAWSAVAVNMNRIALEKLQRYSSALDSLYQLELDDSLARIKSHFSLLSKSELHAIDTLKSKITLLSAEKESLEKSNKSLIRKAVLSFSLWLVVVVVFLQLRRKRINRSRKLLEKSDLLLSTMSGEVLSAEKLAKEIGKRKNNLSSLNEEVNKLSFSKKPDGSNSGNESDNSFSEKTAEIMRAVEAEVKISDSILSLLEGKKEDLISTEINSVCNVYSEIVERGLKKENVNIQFTRDFEKNLPLIKISPRAAGNMIVNVLINAFQSVSIKMKQEKKDYQPKISISTRILPSFIQIRIRDNGIGMSDEVLKMATNEFFSDHSEIQGAGLGLYLAKTIALDHKGEIKIESDYGNSTDVYIKFFR